MKFFKGGTDRRYVRVQCPPPLVITMCKLTNKHATTSNFTSWNTSTKVCPAAGSRSTNLRRLKGLPRFEICLTGQLATMNRLRSVTLNAHLLHHRQPPLRTRGTCRAPRLGDTSAHAHALLTLSSLLHTQRFCRTCLTCFVTCSPSRLWLLCQVSMLMLWALKASTRSSTRAQSKTR